MNEKSVSDHLKQRMIIDNRIDLSWPGALTLIAHALSEAQKAETPTDYWLFRQEEGGTIRIKPVKNKYVLKYIITKEDEIGN